MDVLGTRCEGMGVAIYGCFTYLLHNIYMSLQPPDMHN